MNGTKESLVFLVDDKAKKKNRKTVFGECEKIQKNYQWCCPYDMAIIVYEANIDTYCFDEHQIEMAYLIREERQRLSPEHLTGEQRTVKGYGLISPC